MPPTIYALATGAPPTAIAIVRIAGPEAMAAAAALTGGRVQSPGSAKLRRLRDPASGELLDEALVLVFHGMSSPTGLDTVELHLHGGVAVVAGVLDALGRVPGLTPAGPGDFARAAFAAGRLDLTRAEALADLVSAETRAQRLQALGGLGGALAAKVRGWRDRVLALWADAEAALDFAGEDPNVAADDRAWPRDAVRALAGEIGAELARSRGSEQVRAGVRVVLTGPPNVGKSSLLNALVRRDRAIVSPEAGTTRDTIEAVMVLADVPVTLVDTAGVRDSADAVEQAGVARALNAVMTADLIIDLTPGAVTGERRLAVVSMADVHGLTPGDRDGVWTVSARTGAGLDALRQALTARIAALLPGEPGLVTHARQRRELGATMASLDEAADHSDPVLYADALRVAAAALGRVTGDVDPEAMLDVIFSRFCIGK